MSLNQLYTIASDATPSEILKAAHLDWKVEKMPRYFKREDGFHVVPEKYSVVRTDINLELDTCTDRWIPQQNIEIIELAYNVLKKNGLNITRAGSLKKGGLIFLVADWKNTEVNPRKVGDVLSSKLMVVNSHQVGTGHSVKLYWKRLICTNGMTQSLRSTKIIGHTEKAAQRLQESIDMLPDRFEKFQKTAEKLSETPLNFLEAQTLLIANFGNPKLHISEQPAIVQTVLNLFNGQAIGSELLTSYNTAWALLNSLTEYYSHSKHSRSQDRLYSIVQGSGNKGTVKLQSSLSQYLKQREKENGQPVSVFSQI